MSQVESYGLCGVRVPRVSSCVPNFNTRPYLLEPFESIRNQMLQDWELIVCDGYFEDGAWDYIRKTAVNQHLEIYRRIWRN
jgi:glycosyltransferase involved in cell wall biosynthesis